MKIFGERHEPIVIGVVVDTADPQRVWQARYSTGQDETQ
jgi:hypothetical protein